MDIFRNVFDYFRGRNTKREDEIKSDLKDNNSESVLEIIPRPEIDIDLPPSFIDRTLGGNRYNNNDMPGFHLRNIPHLFRDFSSFTEILDHVEETLTEMERHFHGTMKFGNFSEANFGDMRDDNAMFRESEKTLTGERLRNYYLNGDNIDTYQGENQILALNDRSHDNRTLINNNNRSDFKSQTSIVTLNIGPDGIAEMVTISKDESGNEERIVKKIKLF